MSATSVRTWLRERGLGPAGKRPGSTCFDPLVQPDGTTTYSDRDPFPYSYAVLAGIVDAVGGRAERVDDRSHPRGEAIMLITRR